MILLLNPEEKGCELIIGTYIFIFNVSKPPLFPVWLRELERGKKPQLPTFFFGRVSCGSVDTTLSSAAVDVIWAVRPDYYQQTHRAGWKPHTAELLPFMLAQRPKLPNWLGSWSQ